MKTCPEKAVSCHSRCKYMHLIYNVQGTCPVIAGVEHRRFYLFTALIILLCDKLFSQVLNSGYKCQTILQLCFLLLLQLIYPGHVKLTEKEVCNNVATIFYCFITQFKVDVTHEKLCGFQMYYSFTSKVFFSISENEYLLPVLPRLKFR